MRLGLLTHADSCELLESRIMPVVGSFEDARVVRPAEGFDGVVLIEKSGGGISSGSLLETGRHILTAAHCVDTNGDRIADRGVTISFDLTGRRVTMYAPPEAIRVASNWRGMDASGGIPVDGNDWAIITLPAIAPLEADRYPLYRGTDEVGRAFSVVGYGRSGNGSQGAVIGTESKAKRIGANQFDADSMAMQGNQYAPSSRTLVADFDNGSAVNDAMAVHHGLAHQGALPEEVSTGPGDSGGPALLNIDGRLVIAGVASYYLNGGIADFDQTALSRYPMNNNSFGDFFGYTRVSAYASEIDSFLTGPDESILDLRYQMMGDDGIADRIEIERSNELISIRYNGRAFSPVHRTQIRSLAIHPSTDPVSVIVDASVDPYLRITTESGIEVTDDRVPITADTPSEVEFLSTFAPATSDAMTLYPAANDTELSPNVFATSVGREVRLYRADGSLHMSGHLYPAMPHPDIRVAVGDVNGDGILDLLTSPGTGYEPRIDVFDGSTGDKITTILAFEPTFVGGLFLAVADFDDDGQAEIIVSPDRGGGPRIRIIRIDGTTIADFLGIEDQQFRGGARVSIGDLNGDGQSDILVGAGFGGGPRVAIFDGVGIKNRTRKLVADFFIFEQSVRNGVQLTAGDLNGDGLDELFAAAAQGGGPRLMALDGAELLRSNQLIRLNFWAGDPVERGGVRIVARDLDGDDIPELVVGSGVNAPPLVSLYDWDHLNQQTIDPSLQFSVIGDDGSSGVYVG